MQNIGTLGYVMSELEDGKLFSFVVQEAKRLGYTEPGLTSISLLTLLSLPMGWLPLSF